MPILLRLLTTCLMATTIAGCSASLEGKADSFVPAHGLILVKTGSLADVRAAVIAYDSLAREKQPHTFKVELHPQSDGSIAVVLPDGFPAYDLANMTGWLSAPPDQPLVHDAVLWITSPRDGAEYYLKSEIANLRGDTLVGSSSKGRPIRVYQPEGGVSEISTPVTYIKQPKIEVSPDPISFKVTLDASTAFGNQGFVVNSPVDHRWGW